MLGVGSLTRHLRLLTCIQILSQRHARNQLGLSGDHHMLLHFGDDSFWGQHRRHDASSTILAVSSLRELSCPAVRFCRIVAGYAVLDGLLGTECQRQFFSGQRRITRNLNCIGLLRDAKMSSTSACSDRSLWNNVLSKENPTEWVF
jgi:hypothetical protein